MNLFSLFFIVVPIGVFQGKVLDVTTGEPVPFAEVKVLPLELTVFTDSSGDFQVGEEYIKGRVTVSVSRVGYETRSWPDVSTDQARVFYLLPRTIPVGGVTSIASRLSRAVFAAQPVAVVENEPNKPKGWLDAGGIINHRAAGVQLNDYGNLTTVMLRGANAEQTVVMLDGVRLNTSLNNLADISLISPVFVRSVELMQGGASALYGANPMGGVVNIKTPEVEEFGGGGGFGIASFGRRYGSAVITFPGLVNFLFAGGFVQAKNEWNYRDLSDSVRIRSNNDLRRTDGLFKCQTKFLGRHYLSFSGVVGSSERGSPGPISFPSDSARLKDTRLLTILGYDVQETEHSRFSGRFSHQRTWQNYYNPQFYFNANDTHQVYQTGLNLNQWVGVTGWLTGNLGWESFWEQAKSTKVREPNRITNALYVEAGISGRGWNLKPALRYDLMVSRGRLSEEERVSQSYGALSPKVSLVINQFYPLTFYLGANRSYRAPTFNELWWPNDGWTSGNPKLVPEFGTGIDGGIGFDIIGKGLVRLGVYRSQFTNLIQWLPDSNFLFQPVNVATATISGGELEAQGDLGWFGFSLNTTYQQCRAEGKDLPYRPRLLTGGEIWMAYLMSEKNQVVKLSMMGRAVSRRFTNKDNTDSVRGYGVIDGEVQLNPVSLMAKSGMWHCNVAFGCKNILNIQYQEIKDYPLPGRNIYLEIDIGI
ncbi:MAG: TonB-dependent receptor [bacterium]